jgi:hypothetical protein
MLKAGDKVRYVGKVVRLLGKTGQVMSETVMLGVLCVGFADKAYFVRAKNLVLIETAPPDSLVAVTTDLR